MAWDTIDNGTTQIMASYFSLFHYQHQGTRIPLLPCLLGRWSSHCGFSHCWTWRRCTSCQWSHDKEQSNLCLRTRACRDWWWYQRRFGEGEIEVKNDEWSKKFGDLGFRWKRKLLNWIGNQHVLHITFVLFTNKLFFNNKLILFKRIFSLFSFFSFIYYFIIIFWKYIIFFYNIL